MPIKSIAVLLTLALGALGVRADLATNLNPVADTALLGGPYADNNLGTTIDILAGTTAKGYHSRAMFRFDVSVLPTNAAITSAALTLQIVRKNFAGVGSTFDLFRMLQGWIEGLGSSNTGLPANPGEPTWNNRASPNTPWGTPGGQAGTDYASISSAALAIDNVGSYTFTSTPALVADVQAWLADPGTNFGWILITRSEDTPATSRRIGAREDTLNAPVLQLRYTVPASTQPNRPVISGVAAAGNSFSFSFKAQSNRTYAVEFRDSLTLDNWATLTNISAQSADTVIPVSDSLTNPARYYRVRTP